MSKQTLAGILLAIVLVTLSNSVYVIRETERGVLLKFGEVVDPNLMPGLHLKVPFVNSVRKFDGRILTVDSSPERFFTQEKKSTHSRLLREVSCYGYREVLHRDERRGNSSGRAFGSAD